MNKPKITLEGLPIKNLTEKEFEAFQKNPSEVLSIIRKAMDFALSQNHAQSHQSVDERTDLLNGSPKLTSEDCESQLHLTDDANSIKEVQEKEDE